jgi:ribose transport system ATP-binding protein
MMVGNNFKERKLQHNKIIREEIIRVENISGGSTVKNVSFSLNKSEILGIAGLVGSGRSELMKLIFGIVPKSSGKIIIKGIETEIKNALDAIHNGIGYVPGNKYKQGLIMNMSIKENITLPSMKRVSTLHVINRRMENVMAKYYSSRVDIKNPNEDNIRVLSGGDQQKVVILKWLAINPEILILEEATNGIDINTKKEIYNIINEMAIKGTGIILVTSDLDELMELSDRIILMSKGMLKGELSREEANKEKILSIIMN